MQLPGLLISGKAGDQVNCHSNSRIDSAFADNRNPVFGEQPHAKFREFFRVLSDRMPAPYGSIRTWPRVEIQLRSVKGVSTH